MKNSYIGPLVILILLCGAIAGGMIYFISTDIKGVGAEYKQIDLLKQQEQDLERERDSIEATAGSDESYRDYFLKWEQSGVVRDEVSLRARLNEIAAEVGVRISEPSPDTAAASNPAIPGLRNSPAMGADDALISGMPEAMRRDRMAGGIGGQNSVSVSAVGSFRTLLQWLSLVESRIGNVKITKTLWVARSVEEVRLSVDIEYRRVR